jgi:hypothetical protein
MVEHLRSNEFGTVAVRLPFASAEPVLRAISIAMAIATTSRCPDLIDTSLAQPPVPVAGVAPSSITDVPNLALLYEDHTTINRP